VTIVMVSHALGTVANMCDRALWLDHGHVLADGPAPDVVHRYLGQVNQAEEDRHTSARVAAGTAVDGDPTRALQIDGVELLSPLDEPVETVRSGAAVRLRVHLRALTPVTGAVVGVNIRHENGLLLARAPMKARGRSQWEGNVHADLDIDELRLGPGEYLLDVDVHDSHRMVRFDHREAALTLHVQPGDASVEGLFDLQGRWSGPVAEA
jgi:ABC-type molybdate transport system ATPase subunit